MKRREAIVCSAALAGAAVSVLSTECTPQKGGIIMARFGDVIASPEKEGKEKHVPQIEIPSTVKAGEPFQVKVIVGKEVPHPNTVEHHIKWIQVYAKEEGPRPVVHVGTFDLGPTYASPTISFTMMLQKSSTIFALEYCILHGVWDNSAEITVD